MISQYNSFAVFATAAMLPAIKSEQIKHKSDVTSWDLPTIEKTHQQRPNKSGFHSFSFCMTCYSAKACKPV